MSRRVIQAFIENALDGENLIIKPSINHQKALDRQDFNDESWAGLTLKYEF